MNKYLLFAAKYKKPIIIIIACIVLVIIWAKRKKIAKKIATKIVQDEEQREYIQNANDQVSVSKLSYNDNVYSDMAKKLYVAMDGPGTDEEAVYAVLNRLKSNDDWQKLIAVYGIKENETLIEWILGDFRSEKERRKLNTIMKAKGIDQTF